MLKFIAACGSGLGSSLMVSMNVSKVLKELGITVKAYTKSIGPCSVTAEDYKYNEIEENPLRMPDNGTAEKAAAYISSLMEKNNSCGGIIECIADGLPAGLGEPVFDKIDALLGQALFSVGAVKGVEIGDGFEAAGSTGSRNNDPFHAADGRIEKLSNHSGGTLGGLSDGSRLIIRAAIKPTPSIAQLQKTVNENGENTEIAIHGRHDPVIVPRAVVVIESMTAVTLADLLLQNMASTMDHVKKVYQDL